MGIESKGYFATGSSANSSLSNVLRALMWIFLLPISLVDLVFGKLLKLRENYVGPLDHLLRAAIGNAVSDLFYHMGIDDPKKHGHQTDHQFERLVMHYALEKAPEHARLFANYVVLYGFLRSFAFLLLIVFWMVFLHVVLFASWEAWRVYGAVISVTGMIVFASYCNFFKFYRRYYEDIMLSTTAILACQTQTTNYSNGRALSDLDEIATSLESETIS